MTRLIITTIALFFLVSCKDAHQDLVYFSEEFMLRYQEQVLDGISKTSADTITTEMLLEKCSKKSVSIKHKLNLRIEFTSSTVNSVNPEIFRIYGEGQVLIGHKGGNYEVRKVNLKD